MSPPKYGQLKNGANSVRMIEMPAGKLCRDLGRSKKRNVVSELLNGIAVGVNWDGPTSLNQWEVGCRCCVL